MTQEDISMISSLISSNPLKTKSHVTAVTALNLALQSELSHIQKSNFRFPPFSAIIIELTQFGDLLLSRVAIQRERLFTHLLPHLAFFLFGAAG